MIFSGLFEHEIEKIAISFSKNEVGGGQKPFGTFPKIHQFWGPHPSLRKLKAWHQWKLHDSQSEWDCVPFKILAMVFLKHINFNSYQKDKRDFDNKKSKMEAMEKRLVRKGNIFQYYIVLNLWKIYNSRDVDNFYFQYQGKRDRPADH